MDGEEASAGADGFITNPLLADTDGDGVRDALEVASGSNPTERRQHQSERRRCPALTVAPTDVHDHGQQRPRRRRSGSWRSPAQLKDGTDPRPDVDAARHQLRVEQSGRVQLRSARRPRLRRSAGRLHHHHHQQRVHRAWRNATVTNFTPVALSFVAIPGFANNVDVSGNFAYVAAGAAGLQVVNVANRTAPVVVGALDTPGNANDVRVIGNLALHRGRRRRPADRQRHESRRRRSCSARSTRRARPGTWWSRNNRAYVADGAAGLRIIDVTNPAAPALLGSIDPPGTQKGVDVDPGTAARGAGVGHRTASTSIDVVESRGAGAGRVRSPAATSATSRCRARRVSSRTGSRSFTSVDIGESGDADSPELRRRSRSAACCTTSRCRATSRSAPTCCSSTACRSSTSTRRRTRFRGRSSTSQASATTTDRAWPRMPAYVYLTAVLAARSPRTAPPATAGSTSASTSRSRISAASRRPSRSRSRRPVPRASSKAARCRCAPTPTDDIAVASVTFLVNGVRCRDDDLGAVRGAADRAAGARSDGDRGERHRLRRQHRDRGERWRSTVIPDPLTTVVGRVIDQGRQPGRLAPPWSS